MKYYLRNILAFIGIALVCGGNVLAQDELTPYFTWNGEDNAAQGGSISLSDPQSYHEKEVTDEKGEKTIYKVIELYDQSNQQAEVTIKLDEPIKKDDVLSLKGFYYFGKEMPEGTKAIVEIGGETYDFTGFVNIYKNGEQPVAVSSVLDKKCAGATEIKIKAREKTLWLMEIVLSHDPNSKTYLTVTPAPGSTIDLFKEFDSALKVQTNFSADRIFFDITDNAGDKPMLSASMVKAGTAAEGVYTYEYEFQEDLYLYQGHEYGVHFQAYEDDAPVADSYDIVYYGGTMPPYSDVTLIGQTPAAGEVISSLSDNVVTLEFSAEANVEKITITYGESTQDLTDFAPADDAKTKWNATISQQVINDNLSFTLKAYATDSEGRKIVREEGVDYVEATFQCNVPKLISISPMSDFEYDELTAFTLSYAGGIELADPDAGIVLEKDGVEYAGELQQQGEKYVYALLAPATKAGAYQLTVPRGMFKLGIGFDNEEMIVEYTVRKKEYDADITCYRIDGETSPLNTFASFTLNFEKGGYIAGYVNEFNLNKSPILVVDEEDQEVARVNKYEIIDGKAAFRCFLNKDIITSGIYYVDIPAKIFFLSRDINNLSYIPSEEMLFEVTVVQSENPADDFGPITITPANGSVVNTLSRVVIRFEDAFSTYLADGAENTFDVYEMDGDEPGDVIASKSVLKKYYTPEGMDMDGRLNISLCFDPAIKKAGKYTTTIPANTLYITYSNGLKLYFDRDWTFTYTVDPNAGIEDIYLPVDPSELDENSFARVYNLQGIMVRQGKLSEVLEGLHGLYIVNGYKLFIK